jgi:nucleotide-binding universal stress UspA family protein
MSATARATGGKGIVVGVDGSDHAGRALRWALGLTGHFGPVQAVFTWQLPWWAAALATPGVPAAPPVAELQERSERELERALSGVDPRLLHEPLACEGAAGPTLVELSRRADLLVVGTRGRNAVTNRILGSVSSYCAAHAAVPVAVVPGAEADRVAVEPPASPPRSVVVGMDGSANASRALRWVLERLPEASVLAIGCWALQTYGGFEYPALPVAEIEAGNTDVVAEAIRRVTAESPEWPSRVTTEVTHGDARRVLREAAIDRDALVLGARGHRGLAHMLLGSVTTSLVHQPVVPTIVVPSDRDGDR